MLKSNKIFFAPVILLLFLSFAHMQAIAQQKFIEVNVDDTAMVEPDIFVYRVTVTPDEDLQRDELRYTNLAAYQKKLKAYQAMQKQTFDSLKNSFIKSGFSIFPPTASETYMVVNNEYKVFSLDIFTTTIDSVELIYNRIAKSKIVIGTLEKAVAKDELRYYKNLYEKLIAKATAKAKMIAASANVTLGAIYSVTEIKPDEEKGGWTAYPPLSTLSNSIIPGWHTTIKGKAGFIFSNKTIETNYLISNSLTIRFTVE